MNYCCEKFKFEVSLPNTTSPNIRVVKMLPIKGMSSSDLKLAYLTSGYTNFSLVTPKIPIYFCPFCGLELKQVINNIEFHNEEEGITFH